jgi:hypothetical protein
MQMILRMIVILVVLVLFTTVGVSILSVFARGLISH